MEARNDSQEREPVTAHTSHGYGRESADLFEPADVLRGMHPVGAWDGSIMGHTVTYG